MITSMTRAALAITAASIFLLGPGASAQASPSAAQSRLIDDSGRLLAENRGRRSIAGSDLWLFLGAELEHLSKGSFIPDPPATSGENPLSAILDFHSQLSQRGITLILLPVPAKAAVYPEKLGTGIPAPSSRLDYGALRLYSLLGQHGVQFVDLMSIYLKARSSGEDLYCKSDAHWSPRGALLAARELSRRIKALDWYSSVPKTNFATANEPLRFTGDLVARGEEHPGESHSVRVVKMPDGSFIPANSDSPVLIIGDSHSLVFHEGGTMLSRGSGLFDQLASELGFAPDLIGIRGSGATASRVSLMRKNRQDPSWLSGKKIIVWCLSEREFSAAASNWRIVPIAP